MVVVNLKGYIRPEKAAIPVPNTVLVFTDYKSHMIILYVRLKEVLVVSSKHLSIWWVQLNNVRYGFLYRSIHLASVSA